MPILQVGDRGIFKLKEPFAVLVTPQVVYEVRSIRTLNDCVAAGENPFERYYRPFNISEMDYHLAVSANVCIIGLNAGIGEWIYVPETYVESAPDMSGVKYTNIALGVRLGAVPDELSIEALIVAIKEQVMGYVGVDADVRAIAIGQSSIIDANKHTRLETARKSKITLTETDYVKSVKYQKENTALRERIKVLENYIERNR